MMLLILAEVLSRLFLGTSIEGAIEVTGIFLSLAVFLGFAPCEQGGYHIRVELLRQKMNPGAIRRLDRAVYVVALLIAGTMAWQVGRDAWISLRTLEMLPGAHFQVPVYPAKISAFIGFTAFALQLAVNLKKLFVDTQGETGGEAT